MSEKRMVINKAHDTYRTMYHDNAARLISAILSYEEVNNVRLDFPTRIRELADDAAKYRSLWLDSPLYVEE
jgi:hypothetical protein